ncbi:MAG: coenzyme F420-0:L-glutamate ligase [Acetobacteraceae bacterium]|nr:coenzyme F420-0:L-glutamate ligase [Acetobacteraceae bacterium]
MTASARLDLFALPGFPLIRPGDDLAELIVEGVTRADQQLRPSDIVVIAQKIVSKAENRVVDLGTIEPSAAARELATEIGKDPRLVHVILSESRRIVRKRGNLLIMQHRLGFVMANAGVDHSNVAAGEQVLLLPADPDASAAGIRAHLSRLTGVAPAVVITDSFGRPWRRGSCGVAIGAAGLPALVDMRGMPDLFGRKLEVTQVGLADEVAAAASLLQGQADEGQPVVILRGLYCSAPEAPAAALVRPEQEDLFR